MNIRFKRLEDIHNRYDLTGPMEEYFTGKLYKIVRKSEPYMRNEIDWITIKFPDGGSWHFQTDWIDNSPQVCYDDIMNMFKEEL